MSRIYLVKNDTQFLDFLVPVFLALASCFLHGRIAEREREREREREE